MAGSGRRKASKPKKNPSKARYNGLAVSSIPSPFGALSEDERRRVAEQIGTQGEEAFRSSLAALEHQLRQIDPLQLLGMFAFYDLSGTGGRAEELSRTDLILQHQVEVVQALALRSRLDDYAMLPVLPPTFYAIRQLVREVTLAFVFRRYKGIGRGAADDTLEKQWVIERIRLDTQAVRNWGYSDQMFRIVTSLFEGVDERFEATAGVTATGLLRMWQKLAKLIGSRVREHAKLLVEGITPKRIEDLAEAYSGAFLGGEADPQAIVKVAAELDMGTEHLRSMLMAYSDLRLTDIFRLTLDDFVQAYPTSVEAGVLRPLIEEWSLGFGDLGEANVEYFLLNNPIWEQPLVRLDEGSFFWPIPGAMISFLFRIMERVMRPHTALTNGYERRRGEFLEEQIERLFRAAFPNAAVFRGSKWTDPETGTGYENDGLIRLDSILIIVEAKAGRVADPARRGGEKRLERVIDDLIVTPARQSKRFADFLLANPGIHRFQTDRGDVNEVDVAGVRRVVRLSVILEQPGDLQTHAVNLKRAGLVDTDAPLAPVMQLADLEIVLEILDSVPLRLHYLIQRAEIETAIDYTGDEIDLLGLYLRTGFVAGEIPPSTGPLLLYGASETVDKYLHNAKFSDGIAPKPKRKLTPWWRNILRTIEERGKPGWTEIAQEFLRVGYRDQVAFERELRQKRQNVRRNWSKPNHQNTVIFVSPDVSLAGLAYTKRGVTRDERNRMMEHAGSMVLDRSSADRTLVIGIDVDDSEDWGLKPYDVLVWLHQSDA